MQLGTAALTEPATMPHTGLVRSIARLREHENTSHPRLGRNVGAAFLALREGFVDVIVSLLENGYSYSLRPVVTNGRTRTTNSD